MSALIILPTYNEKDNIRPLLEKILHVDSDSHVLVVDDDSPDGTGRIAGEMTASFPRVHVLRRTGDRGRGLAGVDGFKYALDHGYNPVLEMDADFSHNPEDIPRFLEAIKNHDVVIGSRFVKGGGEEGRPFYRRGLSIAANVFIRRVLKIPIKDCTSGFRCFRRKVLESIVWDQVVSEGPSIVEEMLYRCAQLRCDIFEIPILFTKRKSGKSKLEFFKILGVLFFVTNFKRKTAQ